ncbi:MAG TPA: TonB-dependent receptor [Kofleriaceae bacterium]|nr:TonB-dependent receptor [Kofleriaceae bacterium]
MMSAHAHGRWLAAILVALPMGVAAAPPDREPEAGKRREGPRGEGGEEGEEGERPRGEGTSGEGTRGEGTSGAGTSGERAGGQGRAAGQSRAGGQGRAAGQDRDAEDSDPLAASVTSTRLSRRELDRRLHLRPRDLLRHVPGLVAIARSGAATQMLVRGFDAGQGAELEVTVDGVPINLGSHASSHGHADTQFVIADTVESLALYEGNYAARQNELATAGSLELRTLDEVPGGGAVVRISSGVEPTDSLRTRLRRLRYQLVGMFSPELQRGTALLAGEIGIDDGPFVHPQRFRRGVLFGKWKRPLGDGTLSAALQLYSGRWFDSGSLPASAIAAGRLTPFSAADPTQGGIAVRGSASLTYEVQDRRGATWHLSAYAVGSDLRIYDNPTLFLRDVDAGSALEYVDRRSYYGFTGFYSRAHRLGPVRARLRVGVQGRTDDAEVTTWHVERRLRLVDCFDPAVSNPCTDMAVRTADLGVYAEETLHIGPRLRVLAGVRQSQHTWNVDDVDDDTKLGRTTLGGTGARARIDPKLGVSYVGQDIELVLLGGAGHHASDARASVATNAYGALIRTYGGELGVRVRPGAGMEGAIALWGSQIESELAWAADVGAAYRVPASRRYGVEARLGAAPAAWLTLDAALGVARGSTSAGEPLPLAPRIAGTAGAAVHWAGGFASARLRALGARATSDPALTARGHTLIDVIASQRWRAFELGATIENLLDARWYESQLAGDVRASRRVEPTRDLLVTPGAPLTVMLTLGYAR